MTPWYKAWLQEALMPPSLPEEMKRDQLEAVTLRNTQRHSVVHVVGVSHLGEKSVSDVRAVVRWAKPDLVMLELCEERQNLATETEYQHWVLPPLAETLTRTPAELANPFFWFYTLYALQIQAILETSIGAEQACAAAEAKRQRPDVAVVAIDAPYTATVFKILTALWFDVGVVRIAKELWSGDVIEKATPLLQSFTDTSSQFEALVASRDALTPESMGRLKELAARLVVLKECIPDILEHSDLARGVASPLLAERDTILAFRMHQLSKQHRVSVATLGVAHVAGVTQKFGRVTAEDCERCLRPDGREFWMLAQVYALTLVTPCLGLAASYKARKVGGDVHRYFKYGRRAWIACGLAATGYGVSKLCDNYNNVRRLQQKILDYKLGQKQQPQETM
eukprot:gene18238-28103_t